MLVCGLEWERTPDEGDVTMIKKAFPAKGGPIGTGWDFAAAAQIHAAQDQRPPQLIFEIALRRLYHRLPPAKYACPLPAMSLATHKYTTQMIPSLQGWE